ncbi:hypothetical protein F5B22DRAFT_43309 [Xylaria bambusicola]|uniref:uncharacterized protein n=1 Tax=Xylaria bambusicola TaxID=326684 RepID=UPI0020071F11|nr:uncharacterized protein F5B22DRAFT_43309 [Xylaria bambusicola]KAI0502892.1 hypothetical protein F5B22DRAFT_43309 [Xylaria bambusicola]
MKQTVRDNHYLLSLSELSLCDGPKLGAFQYRDDPIEWLDSTGDRPEAVNSSRQGYVFKVKIRSEIYASKVFKFFDPSTYRFYLGPTKNPVSEDELASHTDPFHAECRM